MPSTQDTLVYMFPYGMTPAGELEQNLMSVIFEFLECLDVESDRPFELLISRVRDIDDCTLDRKGQEGHSLPRKC